MKVLIWFLCILANATITTLINEAGIILGGIPTALMFGATLWLARTICRKWDDLQARKKARAKYIDGQRNTEPTGQWQCSCGRSHPQYVSSCVCGQSKSDFIDQLKPAKTIPLKTILPPASADQIRFCRKCGEKLIENSQFCSKCGTQITLPPAPPAASESPATVWVCEKCNAKNLGMRNDCWSCRTPR